MSISSIESFNIGFLWNKKMWKCCTVWWLLGIFSLQILQHGHLTRGKQTMRMRRGTVRRNMARVSGRERTGNNWAFARRSARLLSSTIFQHRGARTPVGRERQALRESSVRKELPVIQVCLRLACPPSWFWKQSWSVYILSSMFRMFDPPSTIVTKKVSMPPKMRLGGSLHR